jgi:hypothetical protein
VGIEQTENEKHPASYWKKRAEPMMDPIPAAKNVDWLRLGQMLAIYFLVGYLLLEILDFIRKMIVGGRL